MLIIVESPAKAKTISHIVGKNYTVKASIGHIRQLSDDKKTKDGKPLEINGIDIQNNFRPIYEIDEDKKKVVNELKKLAKESKEILFATDEDREGEAISWHLAKVLNLDPAKIKRLVFHEITKSALEKALKETRNLDLNLVSAQQARQVLDKIVGYKLSPVLWSVMSNYRLSAGRVQSPALKIIVDRENEIEAFIAEEYWEIYGQLQPNKSPETQVNKYLDKTEEKTEFKKKLDEEGFLKLTYSQGKKASEILKDEKTTDKVTDSLTKNPEFRVQEVQSKTERVKPKPPFITSTLQQAASSKLGFTPKSTMRAAQKLYEGVAIDGQQQALITYMRTDSVNLSAESILKARSYIKSKYPKFLPEKPNHYTSKSRNAQEAHEAIRPVDPTLSPDRLKGKIDSNLFRLYELIWKRMISSQMTSEVRQRFTFELENQVKDKFQGSVAWTTEPGFQAVWSNKKVEEASELDKLYQKNQKFNLRELNLLQNFTSPPSRYSPASLIKKMEELGIGRPSTYATIISTLHDRQYVEDNPKTLIPTFLGRKVCEVLVDNFEQVTNSELTAELENNLDKISRGESKYEKVLDEFWSEFKKQVEEREPKIIENKNKYRESQTKVKDPKYGNEMVLKFGRFGAYYENPNYPESRYPVDFREKAEKLEQTKKELGEDLENIKCPECGAEMELKVGRFGEYFQCLDVKDHKFPKNFREYNIALKEAKDKFSSQTKNKTCEVCGKDLIVRVSKSSLKPYIACPDYKVGNKHTVINVNYGDCPECQKHGRKGKLELKNSKKGNFLVCNLPKKECGYVEIYSPKN